MQDASLRRYIRGLEDSPELVIDKGTLLAGRYRVVALIGKGSFSRVVQCYDEHDCRSVSVKILHNDKDCVDQGIGEVRILQLLTGRDCQEEVPLLRLIDYFYYKEVRIPQCPNWSVPIACSFFSSTACWSQHLLIVTELLRDSIFNFYRYLRDTSPEGHGAYFSLDTLRTLSIQLLTALAFLHRHDSAPTILELPRSSAFHQYAETLLTNLASSKLCIATLSQRTSASHRHPGVSSK